MSPFSSTAPLILIADDDRDVADVYSFLLSAAGYRVARAYEGLTALALAKAAKPDLALLNQGMPGMTGLGILEELRAAGSATKVIITSAALDFNALAARSVLAGADGCLRQPLQPARLLKLLAGVLGPGARKLRS